MGWYAAVGRPVLAALPAETAHRVALVLLGLPLPWGRIGGALDDPVLRTELAGIPIDNPVGLAAGFDKGMERLDPLGALGFGFVTGGTVTRAKRPGNPAPRIVRDRPNRALVNSMGLPNPGAEAAAVRLARGRRTAPRIASVADEDLAEAAETVSLLDPLVDGFELNASSPNAGWAHRAAHVEALLNELRGRTVKPIFLKLPPFERGAEEEPVLAMAVAAGAAGASGLICSNTRPVQERRLASGRGGLSGPPLFTRTPQIVRAVRRATGAALPIVACGGIGSTDEVVACLAAGASAVQIYTAFVYRGPGIVGELTRGLAAMLHAEGRTLQELVGSAIPD